MDNLVKILFFLGIALVAMVFFVERFAKPISEEQQRSIGRWILPLIAVLLVLQLILYYSGSP